MDSRTSPFDNDTRKSPFNMDSRAPSPFGSRKSSFSFREEVVIVAGLNSIDIDFVNNRKIERAKYKKQQNKKKKWVLRTKIIASDICSLFALLGLALMVLENELIMNGVYGKDAVGSYVIKCLISISTVYLLVAIVYFNLVDYYVLDWRTELDSKKIFYFVIELILFSIHPIPGEYEFVWSIIPIGETEVITVKYQIDVILSLLMVSRFYIFLRTFLLHLKIFHGKFQFIGRINAVEFDLYFKIKTLTTLHPGRVLFVFNLIFILTASWYLRLTERLFDFQFDNISNSIWCIIVTFLTIGYGDMTPVTLIGRIIVIITGLVGIASSSLLIAVLAQKLKLSKAEALVHTYISNDHLSTVAKHSAALVIQKAWLVYKFSKKSNNLQTFLTKRRLCAVIRKFQKAKLERKRQTIDNDYSIELKQRNLYELQMSLLESVNLMKANQEKYIKKIDDLQETVYSLQAEKEASNRHVDVCKF